MPSAKLYLNLTALAATTNTGPTPPFAASFQAFGPKGYAFGVNAILYALTH